jgi:hypothetical protein
VYEPVLSSIANAYPSPLASYASAYCESRLPNEAELARTRANFTNPLKPTVTITCTEEEKELYAKLFGYFKDVALNASKPRSANGKTAEVPIPQVDGGAILSLAKICIAADKLRCCNMIMAKLQAAAEKLPFDKMPFADAAALVPMLKLEPGAAALSDDAVNGIVTIRRGFLHLVGSRIAYAIPLPVVLPVPALNDAVGAADSNSKSHSVSDAIQTEPTSSTAIPDQDTIIAPTPAPAPAGIVLLPSRKPGLAKLYDLATVSNINLDLNVIVMQ